MNLSRFRLIHSDPANFTTSQELESLLTYFPQPYPSMSNVNPLVAAALSNAGITRGTNDSRGVVGRVSSGGGRGYSSGMELDRDGPSAGRPSRNRKVSSIRDVVYFRIANTEQATSSVAVPVSTVLVFTGSS
jgi:hypothetical protein